MYSSSPASHRPLQDLLQRVPAVWPADAVATRSSNVVSSGFAALDAVLPGGGWPVGDVIELLTPQFGVVDWSVLSPAAKAFSTDHAPRVVMIGPPNEPYLPGLRRMDLPVDRVHWVVANKPAERAWVAEQLVKCSSPMLLMVWMSHARADQIRRLQVCAQSSSSLIFVFRPELAARESSASPLRLVLRPKAVDQIEVSIHKRRGAPVPEPLVLQSVSGGIDHLVARRKPAIPVEPMHATEVTSDVVGRMASNEAHFELVSE